MAKPSQFVQHIERYVDSSSSPSLQAASIDAIASLLKIDVVTLEQLVREMELYLTTTDHILRARGILLVAEVLIHLSSKPLSSTTIHSLIGFFTDRLTDWRALRGALVGCLALLRRKSSVGMIGGTDASVLVQAYLENLQLQSLGQHDRKLSFEILECLLDRYPEAVTTMGDHLVYGICEAIEGEKDPHCLMHVFHIVEVLARLFPDPAGPVASFSEDLFDIIGRYFPMHFTHPKSEDGDVSRDDLSRALMLAFSSSPFFEPFAIPLLLEKLSSSLPQAKVDSLKYLSYCSMKYGPERVGKHAEAIWKSLKTIIISSSPEPVPSPVEDSFYNIGFPENEIMKEALALLQKLSQQTNIFMNLILCDEDICGIISSIEVCEISDDVPCQSDQKMHGIGCILSALTRSSTASCNKVFDSIFLRLLDKLAISLKDSSWEFLGTTANTFPGRLNVWALYLCIQILNACRDLAVELVSQGSFVYSDAWCHVLHSCSSSLVKVLSSNFATGSNGKYHDVDISLRVKGLEILAAFPGSSSPVSIPIFESILATLASVITSDFNMTSLWKSALKSLVQIGSFVDKYNEPEKLRSYISIVVERVMSLMSAYDSSILFPLVLEAVYEIGSSGKTFMLRHVHGVQEAITFKFDKVYAGGDSKVIGSLVQLLGCYSNKLLPWLQRAGDSESVPLKFAISLLDQMEKATSISIGVQEKELLNATMDALKLAVASCSGEDQSNILEKTFQVISLCECFSPTQLDLTPAKFELLRLSQEADIFADRDNWLISLFASVIIALRPQMDIPNFEVILRLLMSGLLKGHMPSAQALGSVVNKMERDGKRDDPKCLSVDKTVELVFEMGLGCYNDRLPPRVWETGDVSELTRISPSHVLEIGYANELSQTIPIQTRLVTGLAWIGKGLLMRGHEKVKDITIFLVQLLSTEPGFTQMKLLSMDNGNEAHFLSLMKSAADAFHVLMSDSEGCLNKKFHATVRPLYKQRFFATSTPILLSLLMKSQSSVTRSMLYRALGHVIADTPLAAVLSETKKILLVILDAISVLREEISDKDMIYSLLLVLSGILMDKNGHDKIIENARLIVNCLTGLTSYPHKMLVRETAIQCLVAVSGLPHARIYPMRTQVLQAVSKVLDDPKRAVRREAVRCRQAWFGSL